MYVAERSVRYARSVKILRFDIPGEPQGKGRARITTRGGFAHAYTPEKTVSYEKHVADCAISAGARVRNLPCTVVVAAFFGIAKSKTKKWRKEADEGRMRCVKKPDCDNIGKIVCDALNGVAYVDDRQVYCLSIGKSYSHYPHVQVIVTYEEEGD